MDMKVEEVSQGIFNLVCDRPKNLGMTFLRPQEHYENAMFRGRVFSFRELKEWWVKHTAEGRKAGRFVYCQNFVGFAIPSAVLNPFYEGKFDPLSDREKMLLELFEKKQGRFFIIGTRNREDVSTLKHEMGHGFYFMSERYKHDVKKVLRRLDARSRTSIDCFLASEGYHRAVFVDERHAYLLEGSSVIENYDIRVRNSDGLSRALNRIYEKTLKERA